MNRSVAAALVVALVSSAAWAEPRKILVLQSEGRAKGDLRTKVDAAIIKLAKTTDAQVSPGDITMTDAAAAVGCKPDAPACRDEILNMLSVDEIIYATVSPKPGGSEVVAYRIAKGGSSQNAKAMIATGQPAEKLDGLAPLFFATTTATLQPPPPVEPTPAPEPAPPVLPPPSSVVDPTPAQPPPQVDEQPSGRPRLVLVGMIAGGASVVLGFMCWGKASDLQGEIDDHPRNTLGDFEAIQKLEESGDGYAGLGNLLFLSGVVVGGISTYYFVKNRRRQAPTTARIAPTVFDGGAGITLTIGGLP